MMAREDFMRTCVISEKELLTCKAVVTFDGDFI